MTGNDFRDHVNEWLDDPRSVEALRWLLQEDGIPRTLGEMDVGDTVEFVQGAYGAGCRSLIVVDIDFDECFENSGVVLVQIPGSSEERAGVWRWMESVAENNGYDVHEDLGQEFELLMLD